MKGKLTPRDSFVLYGVWMVAAFALFLLGLYWGKGQATGLGQEITTQPAVRAQPAVPRTPVQTRLDLADRETPEPAGEQPAGSALSSPPAQGPATTEVRPPSAAPGASAGPPSNRAESAASAAKEAFSIQVGALKTEAEARKLIVRLQNRGYTGILDKPVSPRDPFYRVRVGSYASREAAARAETLLKEAGFLTFIKKVSGPGGR